MNWISNKNGGHLVPTSHRAPPTYQGKYSNILRHCITPLMLLSSPLLMLSPLPDISYILESYFQNTCKEYSKICF